MTYVISDDEKVAARRERKKLLAIWFAVLSVYVVLFGTMLGMSIYLVDGLRIRTHTWWLGTLSAILTMAFAFFTLFFFAIKFRLTNKYVKMLKDMDTGLKDDIVARFVGYEDAITLKDGVYFYTMVLKTKPLRRDDIDERKLLIEHTIPKPTLNEGAKLRLISHANILMAYEVLDPGVPKEKTADTAQTSEEKVEIALPQDEQKGQESRYTKGYNDRR